jgi:Flp pilus assembly protein TadG
MRAQGARSPQRRARRDDERGIAVVWMAITIFVLLGITAIAVDLVHGYLEAQKAQNAADAASLAGVVYLPGDVSLAKTTALDNARENGFDDGVNRVTVTVTQQPDPTKLRVDIKRTFDTFFARAIGFSTLTVHRSAIADYDPPVAMGSPANTFGNQPDCNGCSTAANPNPQMWANVEGPDTPKVNGNAYTSDWCSSNAQADNCTSGTTSNTDYDGQGYSYAVRYSGASSPLTIDVFDAPFVNVGNTCPDSGTDPNGLTQVYADSGNDPRYHWGVWGATSTATTSPYCTGDTLLGSGRTNNAAVTTFEVLEPDDTPWDNSDNTPASCGNAVANPVTVPGYSNAMAAYTNASQLFRKWWTLCRIDSPVKGDYVVVVKTTSGNGNNNFALRAYGANAPFADSKVSIFGSSRIGIFANADSNTTEFYLARVMPSAVTRTLKLDFYDIGDAGAAGTVSVLPPSGNAIASFGVCKYTAPPGNSTGPPWASSYSTTDSSCTVPLTGSSGAGGFVSDFNGQWVSVLVTIPSSYTCNQSDPFDCWLRIRYSLSGGVHDVTTWKASLDGQPVRLVK